MNDTIEKKLKELLPYIIIIGAIFLLFPLLMSKDEGASTYIIQLGVFPLTVLTCGAVYRIRSRKTDLSFCAIAPLFYALTALLYGMWRAWLTVLIYLAAYLLCGYLGQMLGEILPFGKKKATDSDNESSSRRRRRSRSVPHGGSRARRRPRRLDHRERYRSDPRQHPQPQISQLPQGSFSFA